jgi:hypothetical protein
MGVTIWRAIPGYESLYSASSGGEIRRDSTGLVLRPNPDGRGRLRVTLWKSGEGRTRYVHQLVAEAHLGNRPAGLVVCHEDGDQRNNAASNLRWDTQRSNIEDIIRHGHNPKINRDECAHGHRFTEANTLWRPGSAGRPYRVCRTCKRETERRGRARRRMLFDDGDVQALPAVEVWS